MSYAGIEDESEYFHALAQELIESFMNFQRKSPDGVK